MAILKDYTSGRKGNKKMNKFIKHSEKEAVNTSFRDEVREVASLYSKEAVRSAIDEIATEKLENFAKGMCSRIRSDIKQEASSAQNGNEYINGIIQCHNLIAELWFEEKIGNSPYAEHAFKYSKEGMKNYKGYSNYSNLTHAINLKILESDLLFSFRGMGIFRSSFEDKKTVNFYINPVVEKYIEAIINDCEADGIEVKFKIQVEKEKTEAKRYIDSPATLSWWNYDISCNPVFVYSFKM